MPSFKDFQNTENKKKREEYHNQIRSSMRRQYFEKERKQLMQQQGQQGKNISSIGRKEIQAYLSTQPELIKDERELYTIIDALQNYLIYIQKQDEQLQLMYLKFIAIRITNGIFPSKLKIQLINLFTTLIKNSLNNFDLIFKNQKTSRIFDCILVRSKYGNSYHVISSVVSICQFILKLNKQQINQILEYSPSVLEVLIQSLQLHSQKTQDIVVLTLLALYKILQNNKKSRQTMYKLEILQKLHQLVNSSSSNSAYQIAVLIEETFFIDYLKL